MKLKEKLAHEHGQKKECCCSNSGCGGQSQEHAYLAGFEKARDFFLKLCDEHDSGADFTQSGYVFYGEAEYIGEEEV